MCCNSTSMGHRNQTMKHVVEECPIFGCPGTLEDINNLKEDTFESLHTLRLEI